MGVFALILCLAVLVIYLFAAMWAGKLMEEKGYGSYFSLWGFIFPFMIPVFLIMPYRDMERVEKEQPIKKEESSEEKVFERRDIDPGYRAENR